MISPLQSPSSKRSSRGFDAFAKPIDGIRTRSSVGGVITLLASISAIVLFISQFYLYSLGDITHNLDLASSIPLSVVIPTKGGFSQLLYNRAAHINNNPRRKNNKMMKSIQSIAASRIKVSVHITFPNLNCKVLDYSHNGDSLSTGDFAKNNGLSKFFMRRPTEYDYAKATNQLVQGLSKTKTDSSPASQDSCTVHGTLTIPHIGGDLSFFLSNETFRDTAKMVQMGISLDEADEQTGGHDVSHYIHEIEFGKHFPLATNPLKDTFIKMEDPSGVGLQQMSVKLVPTVYKRFMKKKLNTYQISYSSYTILPSILVMSNPPKLPGLNIHYDFNPIAVTHTESRENFFVFVSSLIGIVGGVFVTVGLVSSAVVTSAQTVLKKQD